MQRTVIAATVKRLDREIFIKHLVVSTLPKKTPNNGSCRARVSISVLQTSCVAIPTLTGERQP